ncbi:MAG TPA: epimerase [Thermoanaerobaculia bacterium]|jgi:uncharacterized protein YbjT (DUF2867 family)|nr:epimerase [Thermoanaerobaculia bacterium]
MRILIFGASGSAGGGVLRACLAAPEVTSVRAVVRRSPKVADPRLEVVEQRDFLDYSGAAAAFRDVDACLYCLGISVTQISGEAEYRRITMDFALAAAGALRAGSPEAVFHYISGQGTSLTSRLMWARVKAETERELIARFDAVCWRPGAIDGDPPAGLPWYYAMARGPLFVLLRPFRGLYVQSEDIGRAMLLATREGMRGRILENREIRDLADRERT